MGIQDYYKVMDANCPNAIVDATFDQLIGYRIAVDISVFLYKHIRSSGPVRWIDEFIMLLCTLKGHGIKAVCIFDGPNPPIEKLTEQEDRREAREKTVAKMNECKRLRKIVKEKYIDKGVTDLDEELKDEIRAILTSKRKKIDTVNYHDIHDVFDSLGTRIKKYELQTLPITDEYKNKAKEVIAYMGIAQFQADGEAEALCAFLCVNGYVDAVLSEDTDVLAYGAPMLLSKIDLKNKTVKVLQLNCILEHLELEFDEFRDMCILLSCDYNSRVKGYPPDGKRRKKPVGIGAASAYLMIHSYKTLERCEEYIEDISPLNYHRCRELFSIPELPPISGLTEEDDDDGQSLVPYSKPIDKENLVDFLERAKANIKIDTIMKYWKPIELIFGEDEKEVESDHDGIEQALADLDDALNEELEEYESD